MAELIDYKNVEVRQADQIVLHDVNLHVEHGEMIYLLGKVGSGKSSLMKTIYGALPIAAGRATVLGYDMTSQTALSPSPLGHHLPRLQTAYRPLGRGEPALCAPRDRMERQKADEQSCEGSAKTGRHGDEGV